MGILVIVLIAALLLVTWGYFEMKETAKICKEDNLKLSIDIKNRDVKLKSLNRDLILVKNELRKIRETKVKMVPVTPKEAFPKEAIRDDRPTPVKKSRKPRKPRAKKE